MNLIFDSDICCASNELTILHHHLDLGPEVSSLALQVFYGFNNIQVWPDVMRLPPGSARSYIRKVSLQVRVPYRNYWPGLRKFADAKSGFSGLQHVEVSVTLPISNRRDFSPRDLQISGPPTHFSCNGEKEFLDWSSTEGYKIIKDKVKRMIRELIRFAV